MNNSLNFQQQRKVIFSKEKTYVPI